MKLTASWPSGAIQDAVPFIRTTLATPPSGFPAELQTLQGMGLWTPAACDGGPCTYTSSPSALDVSVDWTRASGTSRSTLTVQRGNGASTQSKADWSIPDAGTLGEPNP